MTSGFFSFKAIARDVVVLPKYYLTLDEGFQVFNAHVDDLDKFLALLRAEGVDILQTNRLDEHEEIPPVCIDLALPTGDPGENLGALRLQGSSSDHRGDGYAPRLVGNTGEGRRRP